MLLSRQKKYSFLFAMEMSEGNATVFYNLRETLGARGDVDTVWLPIDPHPKTLIERRVPSSWHEIIARVPPFSMSWALVRALTARHHIQELLKAGKKFDAAFTNTTQVSLLLNRFRNMVPCVDSMDMTPVQLVKYASHYGYTPVAKQSRVVHMVRRRVQRRALRQASFLLPWSHWTKQSLMSDYGISEERIRVLPPGIDLSKWSQKAACKRHKVNNPKRFNILFVGGNFFRKGGDIVLSVAKGNEFRDCEFHFVTKTFAGNPTSNIIVHNNLSPNSDVLMELYRNTDVFVLPTRADFYSIASLEAMAMEIPVIATNVGGIGDIVRDGENGFLMPVDDQKFLVEHLKKLMNSPDLRARLGANGRRRVESDYDIKRNSEVILEYLTRAADGRLGQHDGRAFPGSRPS